MSRFYNYPTYEMPCTWLGLPSSAVSLNTSRGLRKHYLRGYGRCTKRGIGLPFGCYCGPSWAMIAPNTRPWAFMGSTWLFEVAIAAIDFYDPSATRRRTISASNWVPLSEQTHSATHVSLFHPQFLVQVGNAARRTTHPMGADALAESYGRRNES